MAAMSTGVEVEKLSSESDTYFELSFAFAIFLIVLMVAILVGNHTTHTLHWHFLPEAAATILIGMLASLVCTLMSSSVSSEVTEFDPNFFFIALLPPILFNSGYTMKRRYFFENIVPIFTFAIVGTTIMSIVTGVLLYAVSSIGWTIKLSMAECLTFGSLISATDTVTTLAVFTELHVDPTLFYLVFGESSLNDAVAICLYETFSKFIGYSFSMGPMLLGIIEFVLVFTGSTLIGIAVGMIPALILKHTHLHTCLMHEVGVYVMFSYLPFMIAQCLKMSGVVAIIFAGITMKHYASCNLTPEAQDTCARVFNTISYVAETCVFLNLGLTVFAIRNGFSFTMVFWTCVLCLLSRACHVYPLTNLVNRGRPLNPIPSKFQHVIWYSGLRGAVAFALAKGFPGEHQNEIVATTMCIILISIFIMGGGTTAMLSFIGIPRLTPEQELALDKQVKPHKHSKLLQLDNKYLIPLLTNLCTYTRSTNVDPAVRKSFSWNDERGGDVIEVTRRSSQ